MFFGLGSRLVRHVCMRGNALKHYSPNFRWLVLSAVGKSSGIGTLTLPVPAHPAPRCSVVMKPTLSCESLPCPIGVWNTRPLPYSTVKIIGSRPPLPPPSLLAEAG